MIQKTIWQGYTDTLGRLLMSCYSAAGYGSGRVLVARERKELTEPEPVP